MNTCGSCRYFGEPVEVSYWDDAKDDEVEVERFHLCQLIKHMNESDESRQAASTAAAGVKDGSGYYAAFCVSSEFGCNQWTPK